MRRSAMIGDIVVMALILAALSVPLALSGWALLDVAARPGWVWAFVERRQVVWLTLTAAGVLTVVGGLLVSGWYLLRIRPQLAAVEAGNLSAH